MPVSIEISIIPRLTLRHAVFPREVSPRDVFIGEPAASSGREADFFASALSGIIPYPQ